MAAEHVEESKGGVSFEVVLEEAKENHDAKPKIEHMLSPRPTRAELEEKLASAEKRRKAAEEGIKERQHEKMKHVEEVRAKKLQLQENGQLPVCED